jgi:oligopeptide/dipeptide ABC transporter ATP-binding protein
MVDQRTVLTRVEERRGDNLLDVEELTVEFPVAGRWTPVVEDVAFGVSAGETVGIVGESGSGKTVTSMSIVGLVDRLGGRIRTGSIRLGGEELLGRRERDLRKVRGRDIGMIFQQPTRSLDPAFTVGDQIAETVRRHSDLGRKASRARAVELLERVHISNAARRAHDYPHTFSGGMCQRVMIAMAISCNPRLLIADEPTTALDVTVQSAILDLLREIQADSGLSILFISHDLGVIADICHRVVMMYAGHVVETATVGDLFARPRHPYTEGLLVSIPKPGTARELRSIPGSMSAPGLHPVGCRFAPRCAYAAAECAAPTVTHVLDAGRRTSTCTRTDELELQGVELP